MFRRILLAVALTQVVGCASIVSGSNQSLSVQTRNDNGLTTGAACTLTNNKGQWFVTTPGTVTVHRSFQDLSVKCEKPDDYEPGLATVPSATKGMAFGNILLGGFIGAGVDIGTGAAYDYPELITVQLGLKKASVPAPAVVSPIAAK